MFLLHASESVPNWIVGFFLSFFVPRRLQRLPESLDKKGSVITLQLREKQQVCAERANKHVGLFVPFQPKTLSWNEKSVFVSSCLQLCFSLSTFAPTSVKCWCNFKMNLIQSCASHHYSPPFYSQDHSPRSSPLVVHWLAPFFQIFLLQDRPCCWVDIFFHLLSLCQVAILIWWEKWNEPQLRWSGSCWQEK